MSATSEALLALLAAAPHGTKTYALMDCALESTVYSAIRASGNAAVNLYGAPWQAGLTEVAPHLVALEGTGAFLNELVTWDWYGNWGYFVQSPVALTDAAETFAALSVVSLPDGQEMFFRFQDPRVIRVFLGTAMASDLKTVFGQAARFIVPTREIQGEPEGAVVYSFDGGALKQSVTRFTG